jgi:sugar phosphate isomerase/epimerase
MKWCLNTYKTGQDWELDRLIDISKKCGYHGIEFLMDYKQKHGIEWDAPEELYKTVKEKMQAAGLETASLTSCLTYDSPKAEERNENVRRVKRVIDMANFLNCKQVRVLGDKFDETTRSAVVKSVGECLAELGKYARKYNVTIAMEMHNSFTDADPSLEAIKIAGQPNVGLIFNSVWRNIAIEAADAFHDRIAPHIVSVHTHNVENPNTFEFYRKLFAKLKKMGYKGYISNESGYTGPDPETVLKMYVALYRAFTGE